jgi:hypothetical protein
MFLTEFAAVVVNDVLLRFAAHLLFHTGQGKFCTVHLIVTFVALAD